MPIEWDTENIPGDVAISLSRDGGLDGTYTTIATVPNTGRHDWPVAGPATWNGYLKITPTSEPDKATATGLFFIQNYIEMNPASVELDETPGSNTATFTILLAQSPVPGTDVKIRLYSSDNSQFTVSPTTMVIDENNWSGGAVVTVTALDDGRSDGDYNGFVRADPIESTDPDYRDMTVPAVPVTVHDDGLPPVIVIESVQPNTFEVDRAITLTVKGAGLSDGVVADARLVLQTEDGEPDENHVLDDTGLIRSGTEMTAFFPPSDTAGQYLLRVFHSGGHEELRGAVTVAEPEVVNAQDGQKAIIVAGRASVFDLLWYATLNSANRAYRALRFQGFAADRIQYLTHMIDMDVDGDGETDKDGDPAKAALQSAVTTWAADAEELILYMTDHGGENLFYLDQGVSVSAAELKGWLDALQQARAVRVVVIVDTCRAGSFLQGLTPGTLHAGSERIVVAGAGADEKAWFLNDGGDSFSRYFWDSVYDTGRLYRSFVSGRDRMSLQNPVADITQDGSADDISLAALTDGSLQEILIGRGRIAASTPPEIGDVCADLTLDCEESAEISAWNIAFPNGELSVFAEIVPPATETVDLDVPLMNLPTIRLTDMDEDGVYTGVFDDFSKTGVYFVLISATDKKDVRSLNKIVRVVRTCGAANIKADLNKDTRTDLTDALVALKILAGAPAPSLRTDYADADVDVNGDGRVGMAEAIYALQKAAGVR